MNSIRIVTDSTCDLPSEIIANYGIRVAPLYINIGARSYLDGIDITREAFYRDLPTYPVQPTTAVPSPEKFRALYDALADEGAEQVLSIHISGMLSSLVDVARSAAQSTTSVRVRVVDARQLSLGTGFLVATAARMADAGCSVDEILPALDDQAARSHVFAALDTLEFIKRSGRMNKYLATIGTLLQIKPIMTMHAGRPGSERVRTWRRAVERLLKMLDAVGPLERVAIVHTHAAERVAELRALAGARLPPGPVLEVDITPVIGVHLGPGAVGFAAVGASEA